MNPTTDLPAFSPLIEHFALDPSVVFLNHGSFGAPPRRALEVQDRVRRQMEAEPVRFFVEELEPLLDAARARMARLVGCDPADFAFVTNATEGVNTVVRSLRFQPGDELVTSHHEYNACNNVLDFAAERWGARVVRAAVPFPIASEDQAVDAILSVVTERTRLVLLSHITSPTALVLPVKRLIAELSARGIDTLLDSAHAPGHVPLHVEELGVAYCTGNFHKWMCAPKGSAFLYVRSDRQHAIRPLVISHGANSRRTDRSRFRLEFDYVATRDYSPWLATPVAVDALESIIPGGWPEIVRRNRALALQARSILADALGTPRTCPDSMIGAMATAILPDRAAREGDQTRYADPLQDRLVNRWRIQVPIIPFPAPPRRHVRVSAQVYNQIGQYEYLAAALKEETRA
ncbi:MAG: aminotransferase class V-fold PLP-dependent enzyme [Phycisphaerales bacterium]